MERGRKGVVEGRERPHPSQAGRTRCVEVGGRLGLGLGHERPQKAAHVEAARPALHPPARGGQVDRHGKARRPDDAHVDGRPGVAEVFQREVAAEREADEPDGTGALGEDVAHDGGEVLGRARVVRPREAVRAARAAAEVPRDGRPPALRERAHHPADVRPPGRPFEPVRDEHGARRAGRPDAVEVQHVAVGQVDYLAAVVDVRHAAQERRQDGLPVAAPEARRWDVRRQVDVEHGRGR